MRNRKDIKLGLPVYVCSCVFLFVSVFVSFCLGLLSVYLCVFLSVFVCFCYCLCECLSVSLSVYRVTNNRPLSFYCLMTSILRKCTNMYQLPGKWITDFFHFWFIECRHKNILENLNFLIPVAN